MTTARKISAKEAREEFSEIINQAAFGSKRTIITRHGKEVAAVISISDLERLHNLDRGVYTEEERKAFQAAEMKDMEEEWEAVLKERGLKPGKPPPAKKSTTR